MPLPRSVLLTVLGLAVASTALAGCASAGAGHGSASDAPAQASTPGDPTGTWTSEDGTARLTFADEDLSGTDGCNSVRGSYSVGDDTIALDPGMMTRMACPGVTLSFSALRSAVVEDDRMRVYDADGAELAILTRDA